MKKTTSILTVIILLITGFYYSAYSQNAGLNTTGAVPSSNAVLDLNTGNKYNMGLIVPHVTLGASLTTFSPPMATGASTKDTGMLVYNMNGAQPVGYYSWNGTTWVNISGVTVSGANNGLTVNGGNTQLGGANALLANTAIKSGGFNLAFTGAGAFQLGAASASTGTFDLYNAGSPNAIGISAGVTTAPYNLTLPLAQGAANSVLTNNGAGALSWGTAAAGAANGLTMNGANVQLGGANPLLSNTQIISGGFNLAFTGNGGFQLGAASSSTGTLEFYNATNANFIKIFAGTTTAAYNLTLPTAQGAAGTVLTDNGVGVLSWGAPTVGGANDGLTMNGTNVQLGGANPLLANTAINSGGFNLDFTGGGNFQLGTASTSTGNLQFYNAASANAIGIAAGVTTVPYNLTLPLAQGAANTVLTNNGAGVLSWGTAAAGAANGLTMNGANVQLGGANPLLSNTQIISGGFNLAFTGTGGFQLGAASSSTGTLEFYNAANANPINITAGTTTAPYNLTLPTAQAALPGQVLTNNGAGILSWGTPTAYGAANGLTMNGTNVQLGGANPLLGNTNIVSGGFNLAFTGTGNFQLGQASSSTGELDFLNAGTPNMVGISAGATTSTYNLTLPLAQGAANTVLTNNGAGALTWGTAAAGAANGLTMNGTNVQLGGANPLLSNTQIISGGFNLAFTGTGGFQLGAASSSTGTLEFYNNANANAINISAGTTTAAYNLTLPTAQGAAGTILTNTGAGVLTWGAPVVGGANNGLTMNGTNVQLGGANPLLANTNIISGGFNLNLTGAGSLGVGTAAPVNTVDDNGSFGTGTINMAPGIATTTPLTNAYSTIIATPTAVSTTYTLTLPSATANVRRIYTIVYAGSGGGTIDITSPVAGVIKENGATVAMVALSQGSITLQSDGTNWDVLNTTTTNTFGSFVGIKYITVNTAATALDAGTNSIMFKVIGGGGAGSGGSTTGGCGNTDVAGTGGGGGGYVEGFLNNLTGGTTFAVTIGAGGVGTNACGSAGGNGGNTVLTIANPAATYTGNGGSGGLSNETNGVDAYKVGGAGGTATSTAPAGSYITIQGATGGSGLSSNAGIHLMSSGTGAGTTFGPGGSALSGRQVNEPGVSAVAFGAGGGGAIIAQVSTTEVGGNGFQGLVIIYEYQ